MGSFSFHSAVMWLGVTIAGLSSKLAGTCGLTCGVRKEVLISPQSPWAMFLLVLWLRCLIPLSE